MQQVNSIKVVILAGGFGTRLAEETEVKPKLESLWQSGKPPWKWWE